MILRAVVLLAFAFTACTTAADAPPGSNVGDVDCDAAVVTASGSLAGKPSRTRQTCEYLGVRYAAPPVGDLRFAPPEPPAKHSGVVKAHTYGSQCLQKYGIDQMGVEIDLLTTGAEDCLYLNLWTPKGQGMPVMVFIHGGAFTVGAGSWGMYEGDLLAQEGVVVVTINYRLGPFGFLAYPGLVTEGGTTGNQGILDQIQALKWVKENIAAFGGDPANVTIFGESAGGMSVCTLLASPMAKGLFHAAIIESGGCKATATLETGYAKAASYAVDTGCSDDADPLACMRAIDAETLVEDMQFDIVLSALEPHIDGAVLTDTPLNMIRSGKFNKVPLLSGSNANEVQIVSMTNPHNQSLRTATWAEYKAALEALYGVTEATQVMKYYGHERFETPFDSWFMLKSDYLLGCPSLIAPQAVAAQGVPAYHYLFAWDELGAAGRATGTVHGLELFFVFGTISGLQLTIPDEELQTTLALSKRIRGVWSGFAKNHAPSESSIGEFPRVTEGSVVMDFDFTVDAKLKRDTCAYWEPRLPMGLENQAANLNALVEGYSF